MIPFEDGYIDPQLWSNGIFEYITQLRRHVPGKLLEERECLYTLSRLDDFGDHQLGYYKQGVN